MPCPVFTHEHHKLFSVEFFCVNFLKHLYEMTRSMSVLIENVWRSSNSRALVQGIVCHIVNLNQCVTKKRCEHGKTKCDSVALSSTGLLLGSVSNWCVDLRCSLRCRWSSTELRQPQPNQGLKLGRSEQSERLGCREASVVGLAIGRKRLLVSLAAPAFEVVVCVGPCVGCLGRRSGKSQSGSSRRRRLGTHTPVMMVDASDCSNSA